MDDDLTASSPKNAKPNVTATFEEFAPYYLSLGMTLDEFYNQEPSLVILFRKAEDYRKIRREQEVWKQGLYFQYAVASVLSDKTSYPREPFPVTAWQVKQQEEAKERERLAAERETMRQWAEAFARRHGGGEEQDG